MMRALAISPHLDDAAFSCAGLLALLAAQEWRVEICTVFTRSMPNPQGFALACQLDKGLGADVDYMALRRAEDAAACAVLRATPVWLPFAEAPHRGYHSAAALFGRLDPSDAIQSALRPVLADEIARAAPDLILAPQAIGGHVDHVQVVDALRALALQTPIAWWRDYPYVARDTTPAAPFASVFDAMRERLIALDDAARAVRLRAMRAYATQIGFQFGSHHELEARVAALTQERLVTQGAWPL